MISIEKNQFILQLKQENMSKSTKEMPSKQTLFGKENYIWMIAGLILLAIGFILMAGGKSPNPNQFNDNEVYSTQRITVAPILIVAGFIVEIIAIMKKPKNN